MKPEQDQQITYTVFEDKIDPACKKTVLSAIQDMPLKETLKKISGHF